eukprot:TRINITY_DN17775_c0_g1_i1.p1 TRINITY_DN17775_c0_g1~~TRINITY_DN17775_c0_g1_i1.p1  ORF type:complete len:156 (-),score=12.41 TRINITY_DN17775_c0_g1_i1:124-531(-)
MAGVGGFAFTFASKADQQRKSVLRIPSVSLFETLPGLYLQTSLFSLTFDHTSENAKRKQLLSLALGAAALLKNVWEGMVILRKDRCGPGSDIMMAVLALPMLMILCVVATCSARVYFSYVCDSHVWNLTSGCVSA